MISNIKIFRKTGWTINPDDDKVNKVLKGLIECDGHCPTHVHNRIGHDQCPCSDYLQCDICHCELYIKENKNNQSNQSSENKSVVNFTSYGGC